MSDPSDSFPQTVDQDGRREQLLQTAGRFRQFLEQRGEVFESEQPSFPFPTHSWDDPDGQLLEAFHSRFDAALAELNPADNSNISEDTYIALSDSLMDEFLARSTSDRNRRTVYYLSVLLDHVPDVIPSDASDGAEAFTAYKKQVQLLLLAQGYNGAWLDLIDTEFLGESLLPEEALERLVPITGKLEGLEDHSTQLQVELTQAMYSFWQQRTDRNLTMADALLLTELAGLREMYSTPRAHPFLGILEDAQALLEELGAHEPVWQELIAVFFEKDTPTAGKG